MFLISSCICLYPMLWSQVLSQEWRCSRHCFNYIWVSSNFIAYWCATYIRGLTVYGQASHKHFIFILSYCQDWCQKRITHHDIDGLVQERQNSIANTLELSLSCTNPSMCDARWYNPKKGLLLKQLNMALKKDRYTYVELWQSPGYHDI